MGGSGVGRAGSPIAKEMTSTPCDRFSAILRLISANRYGGNSSMRRANLISSPCSISHRTPAPSHSRPSGRSVRDPDDTQEGVASVAVDVPEDLPIQRRSEE